VLADLDPELGQDGNRRGGSEGRDQGAASEER